MTDTPDNSGEPPENGGETLPDRPEYTGPSIDITTEMKTSRTRGVASIKN